jgi:hypothetical protein
MKSKRTMNRIFGIVLLLAAALATGTAPVLGQGNTGSGGTITYTDSSGLNPRSFPPYCQVRWIGYICLDSAVLAG